MSIRKQLQEALRSEDILDLERAITNCKTLRKGQGEHQNPHERAAGLNNPELDEIVLASQKLFIKLKDRCKDFLKPLRLAVQDNDGPGIIRALERVYRAPPALRKNMMKDIRVGEKTLELMSLAMMDAPALYTTTRWDDVDRFLNSYSSVLNEDVVLELTDVRDALLSQASPRNLRHVSPGQNSVSPTREVTVSPSEDGTPRTAEESVQMMAKSPMMKSPLGGSGANRSADYSTESLHSTLPRDIIELAEKLKSGGSSGGSLFPSKPPENVSPLRDVPVKLKQPALDYLLWTVASEEEPQRKDMIRDEAVNRVALYREFLRLRSISYEGQRQMLDKVRAMMSNERSLPRRLAPSAASPSLMINRYRFFSTDEHPPQPSQLNVLSAGERSYAQESISATVSPVRAVGPPSALQSPLPSHFLQPQSCSSFSDASNTTNSTAHERSGAPTPEREQSLLMMPSCSASSSAVSSAASSRATSPTPLHPQGAALHQKPPAAPFNNNLPSATVSRETTNQVVAEECERRQKIEKEEQFDRKVGVNVAASNIDLLNRVATAQRSPAMTITPRVVMSSSDLSRFHGSDRPPVKTMMQYSPPRSYLSSASDSFSTRRTALEQLMMKSPSPPSAYEE